MMLGSYQPSKMEVEEEKSIHQPPIKYEHQEKFEDRQDNREEETTKMNV